ncbi:MAG: manganese efflux pump MntP family protein [Bdellovibrionaceae bacterium]|nr:manganese efflux pump MntP family protein [Pseudobdellovibrionaceae bacterium]
MIDFIEVVTFSLVLSTDSFSAALAMGTRPHKLSDTLKFAFASSGAEVLVLLLGALAGASIVTQFDFIDHWLSFALLAVVAVHMAFEAIKELRQDNSASKPKKFHNFFKILIVSFATSLDSFVVGVTLGVQEKSLTPFILCVGICVFVLTLVGMKISKTTSDSLGPIFSLIGSGILLLLAFKFLIEGL